RSPVAGAAAVGDDDPIGWLLRRADARQPNADCHAVLLPPLCRPVGRRYLTVTMALVRETPSFTLVVLITASNGSRNGLYSCSYSLTSVTPMRTAALSIRPRIAVMS